MGVLCPAYHAGHRGDGFENHGAMPVAPGEKRIGKKTQQAGQAPGKSVRSTFWGVVSIQVRIVVHPIPR